jgi:hypothetical protein
LVPYLRGFVSFEPASKQPNKQAKNKLKNGQKTKKKPNWASK